MLLKNVVIRNVNSIINKNISREGINHINSIKLPKNFLNKTRIKNFSSKIIYNTHSKNMIWFNKKENDNLNKSENVENSSSTENQQERKEDFSNLNSQSTDDTAETEENQQPKTSIFSLEEAAKYAEEKVKKYDFYAFVIASTLPPKIKNSYLAFHAFFIEILRSRYISKEPSVCRMRVNFWEESLKEVIEDKTIKEPILILLKETLKTTPIRKDTLFRMIDFLFFDLERNGEIYSIEDLEIFAENTRSLLLYLTLNLFHVDNRDAFIAASHIGRGIGIVDCLKKMPALIKMNINQIPVDLINKNGASIISLWDRHGNIKDNFFDCVLEVAAYAKKHIEIGRSYKDKLPKNTHIAFLQAVESYEWLLELEKYNFDVLEPSLQRLSTRAIPKKMMEYGKRDEY
jgi:phytoene/squalene synthetase